MADSATVNIQLERFRTDKQQELLKLLNDKKVQKQVNVYIKDAINEFVPMKSGALRRSAIVTHKSITWGRGLKYARYQYYGEVYGPNYPIVQGGTLSGFFRVGGKRYPVFNGGTITGWYSIPDMKKHPTGRELGVPGMWRGWRFGYTTPGTHHHWDNEFKYQVKLKTNQEITRYLKRECKERGLKK